MAYDPITGEYKEEDASVSKRLTELLSRDDPYMQQASTRGNQQANRRGLLNSSIAVGAVENERIRAGLPIASQEAGQAHEMNLQGRNIQIQDIGQKRDIENTRYLQGQDITSRERMQGTDIASRERMQGADIASQEHMQQLQIESNQRIADMNLAAADRNAAASIAVGLDSNYSQIVATIMNNPDIPAADRQRYLDHAAQVRNSGFNLLEQFFGIDLTWNTPGAKPAPALPGRPIGPGNRFRGRVAQR